MPAEQPQIDTRIEVVTPENIAFQYRLAGPFRRLVAYLVDMLIRIGLVLGLSVLYTLIFGLAGLPEVGGGLTLVTWFVVAWFYGGLYETFRNGQTPGKRLLQIRVVSVDGQPINGLQAVMRNILRMADSFPVWSPIPGAQLYVPLYQVGLISAVVTRRFQRLGDVVCGTMVVLEERDHLGEIVRVTEPQAILLASMLPGNFEPSAGLARALSGYMQRRRNFGYSRRLEIARHLAVPLIERFNLPPDTNPDLLLCALYHRTFIADRPGMEPEAAPEPPPPPLPAAAPAGAAVRYR